LVHVFVIGSLITAILSLDATVVLLTPVVFATAARIGARPGPHVYACTHLANTASLLLPVSNLTNLLAFAASGLSFTHFASLMALPWLVAVLAEFLIFGRFFATDLDVGAHAAAPGEDAAFPVFALVVLVGTLGGVTSPATAYSPLVGAQLDLAPGAAILDLDPAFEHAVLLGGAPWTEPLVMWWNFVAREHDEIVAARAAWEARDPRFGEVAGHDGARIPAPPIPPTRLLSRRRRH